MGRLVKINNNQNILLNNITQMVEGAMHTKDYLITEQDIADKYKIDVQDVILLEKEAIPFEVDLERNPKIRRVKILKNLKKDINFYKENTDKYNSDFTDAIIVNEEGKILFGLRNKEDNIEPNKWCLLGSGHQEKFLSPERNVKKEIMEETGLAVLECKPIHVKKINGGKNKITYFYCTIPPKSEVVLNEREHQNYKWMSVADIKNMSNEEFIFDLREYLLYNILGLKKD